MSNGKVRRTRTFLSVYYALMVEYRAELFFWALSGSLPFIMMGVWMRAADSGSFGMSSLDLVRYFLAVFITRQLTFVWVIYEFETEVVEGRLSPKLLQPADPVWHAAAGHLSERLARLPMMLGLVALFFALYPDAIWVPAWQHLLAFAGVVLAVLTIRFLLQYTLALGAFWVERITSIESFFYLTYLMLSGMLAPLELFPETVRTVAMWTPFPYMVHFPSRLLTGAPVEWGQAALVFVTWGALLLILNRLLWRRGLRRYSAMGA